MKVSQLHAFKLIHIFWFICISKSHFNSSISKDDNALSIKVYSIIRADHPSDAEKGGIFIYYKDKISVRQVSNISLSECLVCEIVVGKKKVYTISLYCSPSKNQGKCEHFLLFLKNLSSYIRNQDPIGGFTTS